MRMPVITRFAKNDRALSGRRRIAVLAATTVLAGGVQFLATDSAWACGAPDTATKSAQAAPAVPAATHDGSYTADFHMTPDGQSITAGGAKVEIGVSVGNVTGAPYQNVSAMLALYNPKPGTNLRPEDLTVEVATAGGWKSVGLRHGCDPTLFTLTSAATTTPNLETGRVANVGFRVGLSAKAPKDLTEIQVGLLAQAPGFPAEAGPTHTYRVQRTAAPAAPTTPAKPTKPAPTKTAKPAPAEPAADRTPAKAAEPAKAPTAAPSTPPATTAPAGTPELAQTGASSTHTFLAVSSAALLALGAGVLIAVRRLRPQR
ncbi:hypothetical protein [Kitasatospora sp. NPDC086791]|uniref:hypothetical protein n=1 Tax=Kitasatospora sp. NPDC086791 TaxID=3155178 RepID=UPI00344A2DB6